MSYSEEDADPLIKDHALEWLVCLETYNPLRKSLIKTSSGIWNLMTEDEETCVYLNKCSCTVVVGFRGTQTAEDIYVDDWKLVSRERLYPRFVEADEFCRGLLKKNPGVVMIVTGHSLGGAIARDVAKSLSLQCVTFNAAAPPSAPVMNALRETPYHIVPDIISAWQSPLVVRIDKGFKPKNSILSVLFPFLWWRDTVYSLIPSHSLSNFSNSTPGSIFETEEENRIIQRWFNSMPYKMKIYALGIMSVATFDSHLSLPELT